ncbi:LytR/AlgR family response regulator transcription factor [Fulvivirga ligni]|uniref:LytR/AlgR family response regulator transcription factor n=1 Tax=Fulvivirga ligni TaxID=2904246 RepID=UPI001F15DC6A|nr:LytTR family DNA-binding domain-containing protein [Fulvivirga ligni]UII20060.1 LytTR family DNA-binding domain-containing protein [Fulvivirga ligni]
MRVLIIEDERPAAARLEKLLLEYSASAIVLDKIDSVKNAINWFHSAVDKPELIFMDIQLADGISFEIFEHVEVPAPVIFTTAFDEYALKAFKVNSIDYLLKPIDEEELADAIDKWKNLVDSKVDEHKALDQISSAMNMLTNKHKSRFIVKVGEHIKSIATGDILYFFSRDKASYCHTREGKNYILDHPLEKLEGMLDPQMFFRINRKYIISHESFTDIISYSNSRLRIVLQGIDDEDVIVSRDRVNDFKVWLDT